MVLEFSLASFEETLELRLAELRSALLADHELALQQARQQLALENSQLRSDLEALRKSVAEEAAREPLETSREAVSSSAEAKAVAKEEAPSVSPKEAVSDISSGEEPVAKEDAAEEGLVPDPADAPAADASSEAVCSASAHLEEPAAAEPDSAELAKSSAVTTEALAEATVAAAQEPELEAPKEEREEAAAAEPDSAELAEANSAEALAAEATVAAAQEPESEAPKLEEPAVLAPEECKVPALADILRWAKPTWTKKERMSAEAKLSKVGVLSSEELLHSLAGRLNERLREAGLTAFSSATLAAMRETLREKLPPQMLEGESALCVQSNGEESLMGFWVGKDGSASYEIRSMQDGGFPGGSLRSGLWYCRRLARGEVQAGPLENKEGDWPWEVTLPLGVTLRFQLRRSGVLVCEQQTGAAWKPHGCAERPEAVAWFNTMEHKEGHRYVHLPELEGAGDFPMVGLTAGWVPCSVDSSSGSETAVRLKGTFCDPFDVSPQQTLSSLIPALAPAPALVQWPYRRGARPTPKADQATAVAKHFNVPVTQLRERAVFRGRSRLITKEKALRDMPWRLLNSRVQSSAPQPTLSIVCIRWFNYWSEAGSSDYNVLNDGFFSDLFTGPNSPLKILPGEVEIYTVFVRKTEDLLRVEPEKLRSMLKGKNVTSWYFLWPNCDGPPGEVVEKEFFRFCQRMERLPVRSGWPHQSHLYRILCGKHWIPQMSLNKAFRVPPTTRVNFAHFKENPRKAAERALLQLINIKRKVWGVDVAPQDFKGVVKMGYSWCGSDVLPFKGVDSLLRNLGRLFCHNSSSQKESCLVQECVSNVVAEFRVLVMHDELRGSLRTNLSWMENGAGESFVKHKVMQSDVPGFKMATHWVIEQAQVARKIFGGSLALQKSAEAMAQATVDCWMKWYQTESQLPPQTTRIDFLVGCWEKKVEVWTCEVGENGGSLCTLENHGRNLAALNRAVLRDGKGRFPLQFPERIARNNGEKG